MNNTVRDIIWVTNDGEFLLVSKMKRTHIEHSIAKIVREVKWRKIYLERLMLELRVRDAIGRKD